MSEKQIQTTDLNHMAEMASKHWELDVELGLLSDGTGNEYRLEPRLSRLMAALLSRAGRFVSRRELIERTWPEVEVNEESLTRAIADLRKFLRIQVADVLVIETANKQGYRLTANPVHDRHQDLHRLWANRFFRVFSYSLAAFSIFVILIRAIRY